MYSTYIKSIKIICQGGGLGRTACIYAGRSRSFALLSGKVNRVNPVASTYVKSPVDSVSYIIRCHVGDYSYLCNSESTRSTARTAFSLIS